MILNRQDINQISHIVKSFPHVEVFEIEQESTSGIGSVTTITFKQQVNSMTGQFTIEVSGSDTW